MAIQGSPARDDTTAGELCRPFGTVRSVHQSPGSRPWLELFRRSAAVRTVTVALRYNSGYFRTTSVAGRTLPNVISNSTT
jgi:hypothetical protein